ncbi:MAG: TetR/AcrR family transcriptional regulator [Jatrophihabitantaceae bacterium]
MAETAERTTPAALPDCVAPKAMRSDAKRNREVLIVAAATAFAERGVDTSLEEIARQAGVGIGTLYRHFPTRHDLIEAVYRQEVEILCAGVDELLADRQPDEALAEWMVRFVRYVAIKRGLVGAIKSVVAADSEIFAYTHNLVADSVTKLVDAAVAAGTIKPDTDPLDLLRGLGGFCMANDQPDWQERAVRLVGLLMDGLRYGCAKPA